MEKKKTVWVALVHSKIARNGEGVLSVEEQRALHHACLTPLRPRAFLLFARPRRPRFRAHTAAAFLTDRESSTQA